MAKMHPGAGPTPSRTSIRPELRTALVVFAVAFALRVVHLWQIHRAPFFDLTLGDAAAYDAWARRIAAGDWIGHEVFYQAPLYPYALALVYRFLGTDPMTVRLVQAVLSAASCAIVADVAWRLFGARPALVAGILLAAYPPAIFLDALVQKSVLDLFCLAIVLWLVATLLAGATRASIWWWLGLALACFALTRENAGLLGVPLLVWLALQRGLPVRDRVRRAALFVAGAGVVLGPVAARNWVVGRELFVTTAQFGPNFYIGNNPQADGTYRPLRPNREKPAFERADAVALAEQALGRPLSAGDVSSYYTHQALAFVRADPGAWLRLVGRKFALAWNAIEIPDTEDQYSYARWSWPVALGAVWHFGVLAPLAAFGVWVTWRDWRRLWLLHVMLAAYLASLLLFYVFARYRFPMVPFLVLYAAAGIGGARAFLRRAGARQVVACGLVVGLVGIFSNLPLVPVNRLEAATRYNFGVGLEARGDRATAEREYGAAVALDPTLAIAHVRLGLLLAGQGRDAEAAAELERAFRLAPDPTVANNLAVTKERLGRTAEAIRHLEDAIALDPRYAEAYRNLGVLLASQGRTDEATAALGRAAALAPGDAEVRGRLATLLAHAGRVDEAVAQLRAAITLAPARADLHNNLGILLAERGQPDAAATEFERAAALDPANPEPRRNLARLRK